jgi:hypothetical protein
MKQVTLNRLIFALVLLFLAAGCSPGNTESGATRIIEPTPTLHPFFTEGLNASKVNTKNIVELIPTASLPPPTESKPAEEAMVSETPVPSSTATPRATATPSATSTPVILPTITIYDDTLNGNWSLVASSGVRYAIQNKTAAHNGKYAIAVTPTRDFGKLAFTVKFGSDEIYLRDETLGVKFWLYSGEATVGPGDLAVSVIGSNEIPYWKWNDTSVTNDHEPIFSETRLYDLEFNDAIPPKTWVQVEVWLDELQFDPIYKYVTGINILNGEGFRDTIYIDQVELVKTPGSP